MCVNIIYVCICLYCVICLILYYRSLLICTNKEFMNMGGHLRFYFFHKIYGGLLRSVSPLTIWGPLRLVSVLTIWGPLRSVSVHTFWGPLSDKFFLLLDGAPSGQFLCLL